MNKSTITTNTYRIQANDSVMCQYLCIGFVNFMLQGKGLTDLLFFHQIIFKKLFYVLSIHFYY